MTKLEELKATQAASYDTSAAAWAAVRAAYAVACAASAAHSDDWDAYYAELKKTQEENSND